jgi:uncharacterized protein YjbI with pentapeptide repeats
MIRLGRIMFRRASIVVIGLFDRTRTRRCDNHRPAHHCGADHLRQCRAKRGRTRPQWPKLQGPESGGGELLGANLANASFFGANLTKSNLQNASLADINLDSSAMVFANLTGANLQRATLTRANLREAIFTDADLSNTTFNYRERAPRSNYSTLVRAKFENEIPRMPTSAARISPRQLSRAQIPAIPFSPDQCC